MTDWDGQHLNHYAFAAKESDLVRKRTDRYGNQTLCKNTGTIPERAEFTSVPGARVMPRFFFHVVRNGQRVADEEGIDLPDLADANEEATQAGREIVSESILAGREVDRGEFHITDAVGKELLVVPFPSIKVGR